MFFVFVTQASDIFHSQTLPSQKFAYGLAEIGNIVTVYIHKNGVLTGPDGKTCVQSISTLPEGWTGVKET